MRYIQHPEKFMGKSCLTIINKSYNKTIFGLLMFELILLYHQVKLIALIISLHFISMPFYIDWSNRFKNYNVFWYLLGFNWWSRIECFVSTYCKFLTLWYLYLRYSTTNFAWLLLVALIVMWKYLLFCKNFMVFYMPNIKACTFKSSFACASIFLYWLNY